MTINQLPRLGLVCFTFVVAACMVLLTGTASANDASIAKPAGPQLDASGTRLVVPDMQAGTLSVRWVNPSATTRLPKQRSFALSADQPYSLSADASVLAGLRKASSGKATDLVVFNINTSALIGAIPLSESDQPESVWLNAKGTSAGVFSQGRFVVFDIGGKTVDPKPIFDQPASLFLASPSGRLVVLAGEDGRLRVIDSDNWRELPEAQASIQRTVQRWLQEKGMRSAVSSSDGPFLFPVAPIAITSDDRLMSVSLGENANVFLNICVSNGNLVSSVVLDKRVTATMKYGTSGNLFAVEVVPNSDDPSFKRPVADYGLRIYENYSGKLLSTVPIPSGDWAKYSKLGTKYFADDWAGWLGFTSGDKAVLRIDAASQKPKLQPLDARSPHADAQSQKSCPAPR